MKHFIYLDNNAISSIIAQAQEGLIEEVKSEYCSTDISSQNNSMDKQNSIRGGINSLIQLEADFGTDKKRELESSYTSTTRSILTKTIHDYSFEMILPYIKPEEISEYDYKSEKNYIKVIRDFQFIDLKVFKQLVENPLIKESINPELKLNREQRRSQSRSSNKNSNSKNTNLSPIEIIDFLRLIIPYDQMLVSDDGFLIPLEPKYLRIDAEGFGLKYGDKISAIGIVTNIVGTKKDTSNQSSLTDFFRNYQIAINEVLKEFLNLNNIPLKVIYPLAVYYEIS